MAVVAGYPIIAEEVLPKMAKITLSASGWSDSKQTVSIVGISSNENAQAIYINPVYNEEKIEIIANCNVYASGQGENSLTFSCDTVPSQDLEFYIKWEDVKYIS